MQIHNINVHLQTNKVNGTGRNNYASNNSLSK
jgi:hypothetical protein